MPWDSGGCPEAEQCGRSTPGVQRGFAFPIRSQALVLVQLDPEPQSLTSTGSGCFRQKP